MITSIATNSPKLDTSLFEGQDKRHAGSFIASHVTAPGEVWLTTKGNPAMAMSLRHALRINPTVSRVMVAEGGLKAIHQRIAGFWRTNRV